MQHVDELKTDLAGDGPGNQTAQDSSKVVFSQEQQGKVQRLIDEAYRKAYSKALREKGASEEVETLKGEVERLKEDKKMAAILKTISRHNVVDAEEVAELVRARVRVDHDGTARVVGEGGTPLLNASGVPMGIDEYLSQWLSERPHHLRSSNTIGAGSHSMRHNATGARHNLSDPNSWRSMPREDLDRLLREGVNVQGVAGQTYRFRDVKNPFLEAKKRKFQRAG